MKKAPPCPIEQGARRILELAGGVTAGTKETPARVAKAWSEMLSGYADDPEKILAKNFSGPSDEIVVLRGIEFFSTCEHHLLPFHGRISVAYLPGRRVVGISKLARLVDCFARRLQMQERLTRHIAESLMRCAGARGAAVISEGVHLCMCARGVRKTGATMVTSSLLGVFRRSSAARAEVLALLRA